MAATTADLVHKYIELYAQRKAAEQQADDLKTELNKLEEELIGRFERSGTDRIGVNGQTVYVHRQLWPKNLHSSQDTVAALKASGILDLVEEKHNAQRLAAYVREVASEQESLRGGLPLSPEEIHAALPTPLQGAITVTENITLRVRKGS